MKIEISRAATAMLILIIIIVTVGQAAAQEETGEQESKQMQRDSAKECAICHISWIDVFFFEGTGTELTERPGLEAVASELMCFSCHNGSLVDSRNRVWGKRGHPVNVIPPPGYAIPKQLPLDKEGRIVCATCHSAHGVSDERRFDQVIFLRVENKNSELCLLCHKNKVGGARVGNHSLFKKVAPTARSIIEKKGGGFGENGIIICQSCHTPHGSRSGRRLLVAGTPRGKDSLLCQLCHGASPLRSDRKGGKQSHPVNKLPVLATIPSKWSDGSEVKTGPGGEIMCETCHSAHGAKPGKEILAYPKGDRFCMECHVMQGRVLGSEHDLDALNINEANVFGDKTADSGVCGTCHVAHGGTGPRMWARHIPDGEQADEISLLCLSCHRKDGPGGSKLVGTNSHPVGKTIQEGMKASNLPLFSMAGGRSGDTVSCGTCHDVHKWDPENPDNRPGKNVEGGLSDSFLRMNDRQSELCITCHGVAPARAGRRGGGFSHPVDVEPLSVKVPRYWEDVEVRMGVGGKLICETCHRVHNAVSQERLLAGEKGDTFCIKCHRDQGLVMGTEHDMLTLGIEDANIFGKGASDSGACLVCHGVHDGIGPRIWAREIPVLEKLDVLSLLCMSCHRANDTGEKKQVGTYSHPAGRMVPEAMDVGGLPLFDELGEGQGFLVSCSTCHGVHQWNPRDSDDRPGRNTEGSLNNSFLRKADSAGSVLCLTCHEKQETVMGTEHDVRVVPQMSKGLTQNSLCGVCHAVHGGTGRRNWARPLAGEEGADELSRLCLSCHAKSGPAKEKLVGNNSHPVGNPVPDGMDTGKLPVLETEDESRGKMVTCATCHSVHQWDPANSGRRPGGNIEGDSENSFLRETALDNSRLCVICHADQKWVVGTDHDQRVTGQHDKAAGGGLSKEGGVCSPCHAVHNARGAWLWADQRKTACETCHRNGGTAAKKVVGPRGHPVGIPWNKGAIPLPLFSGKDPSKADTVKCSTCHDPHRFWAGRDRPGDNRNLEGDADSSFLRYTAKGEDNLCVTCHQEEAVVMGTPHDSGLWNKTLPEATAGNAVLGPCTGCHDVHKPTKPMALWSAVTGKGEDARMSLCTGCHLNEKLLQKKKVFFPTHPQNVFITSYGLKFKQAGVDFPLYTKEGEERQMGLITCPTCHNPHVWDPADQTLKPRQGEEGTAVNSYLRNKGASFGFCSDCHSFSAILMYKNYHDSREWGKSSP